MKNLSTLISEILVKFPRDILIADIEQAWTGSEIEEKILAIEKYLMVSTLENDLVGICFPNQAFQGLAILAVIKAKRVPVILSYTDLLLQTEKWLTCVPMNLLLTTIDLENLSHPFVNTLSLLPNGEISYNQRKALPLNLFIPKVPRGTGVILYTSGSTGTPKGICVPKKGIILTSEYLTDYFNLNSKTISPIILPVCHSMALNTQFIPTFLNGGKSYFFNSSLGMGKLFRCMNLIEGTFISLISEVLRVCWDEMKQKKLSPNKHVLHVQLAGGVISEKHMHMALELFPNAIIHKGYGLTEAIRVSMINHHDPLFFKNVVGYPLPFQEAQIRLPDGQIAVNNEMGEIFVKGPNVMLGILGNEDSPVGPDGFLSTGDLGSLNEKGQLTIFGRADSVFKINGLKVSGPEIEKISLSIGPYIRQAKCILVEDHKMVKSKIALFLEIDKENQDRFFQDYSHQSLWTEYKKLSYFPKDIIVMSNFPRTSNGKIAIKDLHSIWKEMHCQKYEQEFYGSLLFYKLDNIQMKDNLKEVL